MWFLSSQPEKDVAAPEADFPAPVASAPIPPTAPAEQPRSEEPVLTATPAPAVVTPKAADEPKQSPKPSPIPAPEAPDAPAADPPRIVAVTMPERIEVRLLTPVGSDDAANSPVSGEVVSPATLSGARVEGRLVESRSSQRANGVSVMELEFATLRHQGKAMRFDGRVAEIRNSQGTPGVDDLGHELKGNNGVFRKGRKAATRIGAAIGGLFGGGKKKDEESSTTVVTASGPNIAFLPGSEFELEVAAWSQLEPTQTK
jgi:hypothetical protein